MTEEEEAIAQLKGMSLGQLELVPYEKVKWMCCCKGCNRYTGARSFGLPDLFWHKRHGWFDPNMTILFCAVHWKFWKRLLKNYTEDHARRKLVDYGKERIIHLIENNNPC